MNFPLEKYLGMPYFVSFERKSYLGGIMERLEVKSIIVLLKSNEPPFWWLKIYLMVSAKGIIIVAGREF